MKLRIAIPVALAVCTAGLVLGSVRAQAPKDAPPKPEGADAALSEYPYLPTRYGEPYIPSVADWQALKLTALGASTTRLTDQLSRQHLTCFADRTGLILTLDLLPQPSWRYYAGGKLVGPQEKAKPDLEKAVAATMALVRAFFPEVADKDVRIQLFLNSESIGIWQGGELTVGSAK